MQFPTWIKPTLRDAILAYLGCTAISWHIGMIEVLLALEDDSRSDCLFAFSSLLISKLAAFTLVACVKGGSRKSRSEYVRRAAVLFWRIETIFRIGWIVLLSIRPDLVGNVEVAGRVKAINIFAILVSYPLVMGLSTLGRNLSFCFVPAPEDQAY